MDNTEKVITYRQRNPCMSGQAIADRLGITRERVRQILQKVNLPTRAYKVPKLCAYCGDVIDKPYRKKYCSTDCHNKDTFVQVSCSYCGNLHTRHKSYVICNTRRSGGDYFFCNNVCQGKYLGTHWGKLPSPYKGIGYKYDWDMIWKLHLDTGYWSKKLSRLLGIPETTINMILRTIVKRAKDGKHGL